MSNFANPNPPAVPATPDVQLIARYTEEFVKFPYMEYLVEVSYFTESGLVQAPASNKSGPCEIVRLHAPYSWKVLRFRAKRQGRKPDVPSMEGDENEVYKKGFVSPVTPTFDHNGTGWLTCFGEYHFMLRNALTPNTSLKVPKVPYCVCSSHEFNFPSQSFKSELAR
jgi:hypothetical protein